MAVNTIKTLELTLDGDTVECQLTRAALVDEPDTEELTTFCGTETSSIANYNLELAGFQDYGQAQGVFDLVHEAYTASPIAEIDFVLTVGGKTRTGTAKPTGDAPFGGDAGEALQGDITLDVIGKPVDGTATP
jgi:hypothetical protein